MSTHDSLAIKYRPKKLDDVIGQAVTVQTIGNAFKHGNLHHAYILAGNKGSGKTSVSRIMAAMENCTESKTEPCGECQNCKDIFSGRALDVKEIDAASNRGIDDMRDLKKEVQFNPVNCIKKYIILDECHSLTGYAAEAALKLIEEPPKHVRFVLCTTRADLLIDTIRSRCMLLRFNKINWLEIYHHLSGIAKQENLEFEEDALKLAAKASKGSVRDSLQNLQTMISYEGKTLTYNAAREVLGFSDEKLYFSLFESVSEVDVPVAMQTVIQMLSDGREARQITEGIEMHLRNLMIIATCAKDLTSFGFLEDEIKLYKHQLSIIAKQNKIQLILEWLKLLHDVHKGLIVNLDPQILLEKYVVEAIMEKKKSNYSK